MRRYQFLLLCLLLPISVWAQKQSISPVVAERFGQVIEIEAEFIPKPNTYHAQNLDPAPYLLKVTSLRGNKIAPITIEYRYESSTSTPNFVPGKTYPLLAFETFNWIGEPRGWKNEVVQFDYQIVHRLIIRLPAGKERQGP